MTVHQTASVPHTDPPFIVAPVAWIKGAGAMPGPASVPAAAQFIGALRRPPACNHHNPSSVALVGVTDEGLKEINSCQANQHAIS